jgi:aspartate racemase
VIIPEQADRDAVHTTIYKELCNGIVKTESRQIDVDTIQRLIAAGAECIILGCTKITMLITSGDADIALFDTTAIHAQAVADWAIVSFSATVNAPSNPLVIA